MMQTILGSGGAIGIPLARDLKKYTSEIRVVGRNPQRINPTDELYTLDILNFAKAWTNLFKISRGLSYPCRRRAIIPVTGQRRLWSTWR